MSAKHTPGPWHSSFKTKRTNNLGIYDSDGRLLASLDVHQLAHQEEVRRRQSDALAMATAPDMLAELQEILGWARNEKAPLRQQEIESIQRLIDKATGAES